MSVDAETVKKVCKLARLALGPEETQAIAKDLQNILAYVDQLQELNLDGIEPTAHAVALTCPTREDEPRRDFDPERALAAAPEREGTAFKVPKIIE